MTKKHKLLLIVDEVQAGCGRCGTLFAYQLSGIEPDIMTLGKGIGGGVPLSALLCTDEVASFEAGDQGGTYNGNPLMTAVGCSVIEQLLARASWPACWNAVPICAPSCSSCRTSSAWPVSVARACCAPCCWARTSAANWSSPRAR